jgi:3'-phosphoadenosine 5'-phosphosulfate sulfotransferase (PAPS reductase)/FAD synthetase
VTAEQSPETDYVRYVVTASGGKGSWGAARYLIDVQGVRPEQITLLFTDTNGEHPDLYRFLPEACRNLGAPLVWIDNDGLTIWDVFRKERMIGNTRLSVCSRFLKQEPARRWVAANANPVNTAVVIGIDWLEADRLPDVESAYAHPLRKGCRRPRPCTDEKPCTDEAQCRKHRPCDADDPCATRLDQPWTVLAPLTEPGAWSKERIDKELAAAGIAEPELYAQGFVHNNCAGACVRAGQAQWQLLLRTNPVRYAHEESEEESLREYLGKDVAILRDRRGGTTKPLPLRVFRERLQEQPDLFDPGDIGGCGCMSLPIDDEVDACGPDHPRAPS